MKFHYAARNLYSKFVRTTRRETIAIHWIGEDNTYVAKGRTECEAVHRVNTYVERFKELSGR